MKTQKYKKTITVEQHIWKELTKLKVDLGVKTLSDVINILLNQYKNHNKKENIKI